MIAWLHKITGSAARLFRTSARSEGRPTDRGRLVGMYLSNANRATGLSGIWSGNQQRHDGKYAQTRRRT